MALRTITLEPGQCTVLPLNATVISLTADGSITATSSCGSLPTPGVYRCWRFMWEDVDGDSAYDDAYFTGIKIGDTTYSVEDAPVAESNSYDNGSLFLSQAIPVATPEGLVTNIVSSGGVAVNPKCLVISIPDSLGQPIIYWTNPTLGGFNQLSAFLGDPDECDCE